MATSWQIIGLGLAFIAGVIGLLALQPIGNATGTKPTVKWEDRLVAEPYSVEHGLVRDKVNEYEDTLPRVERIGKLVFWGYGILMAALFATFVVAVCSNLISN